MLVAMLASGPRVLSQGRAAGHPGDFSGGHVGGFSGGGFRGRVCAPNSLGGSIGSRPRSFGSIPLMSPIEPTISSRYGALTLDIGLRMTAEIIADRTIATITSGDIHHLAMAHIHIRT